MTRLLIQLKKKIRNCDAFLPQGQQFSPRSHVTCHMSHVQRGYTLIETLIAITIIVTATVGPLSLAAKSLAQSQYARDQITAFYLAQEGLEIVRHIRDANPGAAWRTKLTGKGCSSTGGCNVDATSIEDATRCPEGCEETNRLHLSSDSIYTPQNSGVISKFSRTITIVEETGSNKDVTIKATVRWNNALVSRFVVLQERIFDI